MGERLIERAIIVGVGLKSDSYIEINESLAELEDLVYAAGAEVVGTVVQVLPKYNSSTLIGSGKIEELKKMAQETEADFIVFDHSLSGSQSRNLEKITEVGILDRSQLILDIFAQRAQTYEGKLQVELAQLLDQLPRMVGGWLGSLSRQAGGIGTRGPGESALELDRRRIHERVKQIRKKLETVSKNRSQLRAKRSRKKVPSFALIGYTNSGKSTLINKMTQSKVFTKDQVFATLDPTTRQVFLKDVGEAVITDTVGFIRKLPTKLVEAFKATLEESGEADVLIHVIDLSSPHMERHIEVIDELVKEFHWEDKPMLHVFNKVDVAPFEKRMSVQHFPRAFVSAKDGSGLEKLKTLMVETIQKMNEEVELYFPHAEEHRLYELGREAQIIKTEHGSQGVICFAYLTEQQLSQWHEYLVKNNSKNS